MTNAYSYLLILVVALVTAFTRAVPFILFSGNKKMPSIVKYLSSVLPQAIMIILVVYSLRNMKLLTPPHGVPEIAAVAITVLSFIKKKNTILSMSLGTLLYMVLIRIL